MSYEAIFKADNFLMSTNVDMEKISERNRLFQSCVTGNTVSVRDKKKKVFSGEKKTAFLMIARTSVTSSHAYSQAQWINYLQAKSLLKGE